MLLVAQWGVREVSGRYPGVLLGGGPGGDGGPGGGLMGVRGM